MSDIQLIRQWANGLPQKPREFLRLLEEEGQLATNRAKKKLGIGGGVNHFNAAVFVPLRQAFEDWEGEHGRELTLFTSKKFRFGRWEWTWAFRGGKVFEETSTSGRRAAFTPMRRPAIPAGVANFLRQLEGRRTLTLLEAYDVSGMDSDALQEALGRLSEERRSHVQLKQGPRGHYWAWKR